MNTNCVKLIKMIEGFSLSLIVIYSTVTFAHDPYDCLDDIAKVDSEISIGLATRLCSGSWTPEPVKCYQNASEIDDGIPRFIAIDLCSGSVNSEKTLECYSKALRRMNMLQNPKNFPSAQYASLLAPYKTITGAKT